MNAKWKKALSALIVMLLLSPAVGALSAHAARDTIRIGFFTSENYGFVGADGDLRGYDVQLSKAIGMYAGFDAEMIGYDNVPEMEQALRDGEVDALIDFLHNARREQEFIFTECAILEEQVSVYTLNDPDAPTADSIDDMSVLRVGHVSEAGFLDDFMEYCEEMGISPQLMDFHNEAAMLSAMDRGETDACLTGSAVPVGYRVLLSLPPLSSYMMLRAEDGALRSRIDTAITQLKTDDPDYIANLYYTYVASHDTEMSPLTSQERDFLEQHPEISVALVRGAEPFTVEKADGELGGIIPDYYKALGKRLGVAFRFILYDKNQDAVDAVASGEADILGQYYGDIILAEKDDLYDTMEYDATECARLTRSGFGGHVQTIAATTRTAYLLAAQLDPDVRLETFPNLEACYQALMKGKVDAMIGSMTGISWLINQHTMRGVNLSILPNVTLGVRGAVSRENTELMFVLNKAISVSGNDMNEAILENAVSGETDLRTALENLPMGFTIGAVAFLTILVLTLIVMLVLLVRSGRERVALLNREVNVDGLTGAGSRRNGTEMLVRELALFRRYGDGPLVAMFDVDHFKEKNDTYGHEYGDYVLKRVVEILRETLRQSDAIIRWGGDEFILVCPKTHGKGADHILEKVISAINSADFRMNGTGEQITVSVGASYFQHGDVDIVSILRRCDSALYQAKKARNTYSIFARETHSNDKG